MRRSAKKLLIIGWDAADWFMIDPLIAQGKMPHLATLIKRGVRADLSTLEPKLSPMLWTSIATGKTADKHGILNFIEPEPQGAGVRISSSTSRKTKAVWNIVTQAGMKANVVGWYASHPAEPISGIAISNLLQEGVPASTRDPWPMLAGAVHPTTLTSRMASLRVHPKSLADRELLPLIPKLRQVPRGTELLKHLRQHLSQARSVHAMTTALLRDPAAAADCTMVFFDAIDTIGHHFMEFHPPRMSHVSADEFDLFSGVMNGVYQMFDSMLGELLRAAGDDTTVILLSDHGFFSDHLRPVTRHLSREDRAAMEAAWHRPIGVLVMAGPGIKVGERSIGASILDITPTALTLMGLPVGRDMDGRVLVECFSNPQSTEVIESWDSQPGAAGMHPDDIRQDPFEANDAIKQLIDLGYMAALPEDQQAKVDLTRRESKFNLAVVYMTTNRLAAAIPVFEELVASTPAESRYVLGLARCLLATFNYQKSFAILRDFLSKSPSNEEARFLLAGALASSGKADEAAKELAVLDAACGKRDELQLAFGEVFMSLANIDEAQKRFEAAISADPTNALARIGLARCAIERQQFETAVEHALDALEIRHHLPEGHHTLGVALAWLNDLPHAIQSFQTAIGQQPGMIDSHRFLAAIFRKQDQCDMAKSHESAIESLLERSRSANGELPAVKSQVDAMAWAKASGTS